MILNRDHVRVITQQWKYLILPAALIAVVAWLLIPGRLTRSGLAQPRPDSARGKLQLVKSLVDNKAFDDLIEMALRNPDAELRRLAAVHISEIQVAASAESMFEIYNKSDDQEIKGLMIDTFGRMGEVEMLAKIALFDPSAEYRRRALERLNGLEVNSDKLRNFPLDLQDQLQHKLDKLKDQGPPPPPPPPPPGLLNVESGKPLAPLRWYEDQNSVFGLLRQAAYANMRRDTAFFEQVLDEDFIGTGPSGETLNKAQTIADVKRLDREFKKFEFDDLSVSGNEQMAFATFLGTVYFQANGQDSTAQFRYTVNFISRDGQLKIAATHMTQKQ